MLLAGRKATYPFRTAHEEIPRDWAAFTADRPVPGEVGDFSYGAMFGVDMAAETFVYMPAVEVGTFDDLDQKWGRMRVPQAHYAVFVHPGPIEAIRETIQAAHGWLAANGVWRDGATPDFERYGPDFDPSGGGVEIWLPVVPA